MKTLCFYQDNDSKDKAYDARSWLLYNYPNVMDIPIQNPGINPIINLQNYLNRKCPQHRIDSEDDLKKSLQDEWQKMDPTFCKKKTCSEYAKYLIFIVKKKIKFRYSVGFVIEISGCGFTKKLKGFLIIYEVNYKYLVNKKN